MRTPVAGVARPARLQACCGMPVLGGATRTMAACTGLDTCTGTPMMRMRLIPGCEEFRCRRGGSRRRQRFVFGRFLMTSVSSYHDYLFDLSDDELAATSTPRRAAAW
jgi:hypothetical protein